MRLLLRILLAGTLIATVGAGQSGLAVAAGSPASGPAWTVPPRDKDGPIRLPNGRVLPLPPAGAMGPSEMASQLLAHEHDRITFLPGATPHPRSNPEVALTLAGAADTQPSILAMAAPSPSASTTVPEASLPNGLRKEVFGFLPYWMLDASDLSYMQYGLVSTIAYFGVAARADGSLATSSGGVTTTTWAGWNSSAMTGVINAAHAKGVKVVLTITMMAWDSASASAQATLLGNATYRTNLVNNIVATLKARNVDGVNLDFEPLSTTLRSQYTSFVRQLKAALLLAKVGSYLTVCTTAGAATWSTGYDVSGLTASGAADGIFVMGYDYSWSGSSRAGGVAPMSSSYMLDVNESVDDFLSLTSGSKLLWGVPYYGRTWHTTSSALNATTVSGASGSSRAYYYTGAKSLAAKYGRKWDSLGQGPWFSYYDSAAASWIEGYYDDVASLGVKYDMINRRGLAGVGMWHLLMDAGVSDLWNLLANKFQQDTLPPTGGITNLAPVTDAYAIAVSWKAIDVGSGVASYTVQVRDRSTTTWVSWLAGTSATAATYIGTPGHAYEFRVAAKDRLGNTQPWQPAMGDPGASLAIGGFATVNVASLNLRSGAGTSFGSITQLAAGSRVAILAGPVSASGYQWYQVQFGFQQWPSADYPRTAWAAAGDSSGAYLVPTTAPTVTRLAPDVTGYATPIRSFSPNGDGRSDTVSVAYSLTRPASAVQLDVLNASGVVVASQGLGSLGAGTYSAAWNGHLSTGAWAPGGSYLLRITATDTSGVHRAPTPGVDATILGRWGIVADVTRPTLTAHTPTGATVATSSAVTATFSEPVIGVSASSVSLVDTTNGAVVAGAVSYDTVRRTATLMPASPLAAGRTYQARLSGAIMDAVGNPLAATSWSFTTLSASITLYSPARSLTFSSGSHTGYKFDSNGNVVATKSYTLAQVSSAATSERNKAIPGHPGAWFYVVNGVWAGYWLPESPRLYLPGVAEQVTYSSPRTVSFMAGTYTGYRFTSTWSVSTAKRYSLARSSSASTSTWAVINGQGYAYIVNGIWAGYWVPTGQGVTIN